MDYELLGLNIKKYRNMCGLTQEQLSEMADISISFLSEIERAKGTPSLETVIKISNSLNIKVDALIENKITGEQLENIFKGSFTNEQINLLHKLFNRRSEKEIAAIFDAFVRLLEL